MVLVEQIWEWLGAILSVLLFVIILGAIFGRFPSVAIYFRQSILGTLFGLLIPTGIGVLYALWNDDY